MPNGIGGDFLGSMHMYTIGRNRIGKEYLTINSTNDLYQVIKYPFDDEYVKRKTTDRLA